MIERIKKFNVKASNIFFIISLFIIMLFLGYYAVTNRNRVKSCVTPEKLVNGYTSYSYNIKYTNEVDTIQIYAKRYDSKYLFEINKGDEKELYFFQYTDLLRKNSDDIYVRYTNGYIIDGLDNKLLLLDYINDLSFDSKTTIKDGRNCYINVKNNIDMCINLDNTIEVSNNNFKLLYTINKFDDIEDFDVRKNLDMYYEEDTTS